MQRPRHAAGSRQTLHVGVHIASFAAPRRRVVVPRAWAARARAIEEQHDDLYAVLGVPAHASADQIKAAFKRKALELHPDQCSAVG